SKAGWPVWMRYRTSVCRRRRTRSGEHGAPGGGRKCCQLGSGSPGRQRRQAPSSRSPGGTSVSVGGFVGAPISLSCIADLWNPNAPRRQFDDRVALGVVQGGRGHIIPGENGGCAHHEEELIP